MRCACIDIGSNTTALLVADCEDGHLTAVGTRRAFTLIGGAIHDGAIGPAKLTEVVDKIVEFVAIAKRLGAEKVRIVATHIVRLANNGDELMRLIEQRVGVPAETISSDTEARYAFAGAIGQVGPPARLTIVIDAGGGSTEITHCGPGVPLQTSSFVIGSSSLRRRFLTNDPPTTSEIDAAKTHAERIFSTYSPPSDIAVAIAVGGGATTASRVLDGTINRTAVERVLQSARLLNADELGAELGIEADRAALLPASLIVLGAATDRIGTPPKVASGGLREGALLDLAAAQSSG